MKKFLLLALSCVLMHAASKAQRNCNLELNMVSPYYQSVIQRGAPVDVIVTVKNLGPDTVKATDTINYFIAIDNNYVYVGASILGLRSSDMALPVNGSPQTINVFKQLIFLSLIVGYHDFCVVAVLQNHSTDSCQDTLTANNTACKKVWLNKFLVGTGTQLAVHPLTLYPNPATGSIRLDYTMPAMQPVNITIYNVQGMELQQFRTSTDGGHQLRDLDISKLEKGIYFVQVSNGAESHTLKFCKQ